MTERLDRSLVVDYIRNHTDDDGNWPTAYDIGRHFSVSTSTVQHAMRAIIDMRDDLGLTGRPSMLRFTMAERCDDVEMFVRRYMIQHIWPPSQREIADGLGINLSVVNAALKQLEAQGRIERGPDSRQLRVPNSSLIFPAMEA